MVRKANHTTRKGRPPAFDRAEVVSDATYAFWRKGFEETSLSDLETATGVDRSTIYNSFGGKTGLYQSATDAYMDDAEGTLFQPLSAGSEGIGDILEFLGRLSQMLGSETIPAGCLIVNDVVSTTGEQATNRYLETLESGLNSALKRSGDLNETDPNRAADRSKLITAAVLGINLAHGGKADSSFALAMLAGLATEVESWARAR
jgi:AcrR family transcriptional regulator